MKRNRSDPVGNLLDIGSYRIPMPVMEGVLFSDGVYYRCPRCKRTGKRVHGFLRPLRPKTRLAAAQEGKNYYPWCNKKLTLPSKVAAEQ